MRLLWSVGKFFAVVWLLAGCQAKQAQWPARVVSLDHFTDGNDEKVVASIRRMNAQAERPLVIIDNSASTNAYPVHVEQHEPWTNQPLTAGITTRNEDSCKIGFSTELFKGSREDYVDSVVWHEFGHCAGLGHNPKEGTLMFATARAFSLFPPAAISSFITDVENVLWSEPLGH